MKNVTKILASVIGFLTLMAQVPAVQTAVASFFTNHGTVATILAGVTSILALFHNPKSGS